MQDISITSKSIPSTPRSGNYPKGATVINNGGGSTVVNQQGSDIDIVKELDTTSFSDANIPSSLRTVKEITTRSISKTVDDTAQGHITFENGITTKGISTIDEADIHVLKADSAEIEGNLTVKGTSIFQGAMTGLSMELTGLMKAAAATVVGLMTVGSLSANSLSANSGTINNFNSDIIAVSTKVTSPLFVGALQGNSDTATRLLNTRKIFNVPFDGSADCNGDASILGTLSVSGSASFANGGIFYGQNSLPTDKGTYVLNYVSSVYGARITAYNGTNYQNLHLGKMISDNSFQLDLNADGTTHIKGGNLTVDNGIISAGIESSKGGIFFGQYGSMPSGYGMYVANYVSDSYGARVLAYDGTSYKDLKLGSMPTAGVFGQTLLASGNTVFGYKVGVKAAPTYDLDVVGTFRATSDMFADGNIGTRNYVSQTAGWRIDNAGNSDFRKIYADELNVQAFTAQVSQALAGSDFLTKSVSKLSYNFVVPSSVGSTARLIVDDLEGFPATQCFTNGDYIRLRPINKTGGLTVGNAYGTVVLDTTYGTNGFLNGTQAYTFTATSISNGEGLTVYKGSEVLDYGTSGNGLIKRTVLDSAGSPYMDIDTWSSDPSNSANYTTHVRLGNLDGVTNCSGYGLYSDNVFLTKSIVIGDLTKSGNFLSFDTVNGLQIKLGNTSVATTADVNSSASSTLSAANTAAQGYATAAQNAAIGAASTDATNKANDAVASANGYTNTQISVVNGNITSAISSVQIGGTNLILYSEVDNSGSDYFVYDSTNGVWTINIPITANLKWGAGFYFWAADRTAINPGEYLTYSCEIYSDVAFTLAHDVNNAANDGNSWQGNDNDDRNSETNSGFGSLLSAGIWHKVWFTIKARTDKTIGIHNNGSNIGALPQSSAYIIKVRHIKIEKGTKATDWSPAPEDVTNAISTAQSNAIAQSGTNAANLYVTQSNYNSYITQTDQAIAARVTTSTFNALGGRVDTAESNISANANAITQKVSTTDYNGNTIASLINQTATTVKIQASQIYLDGAVTFNSLDSSTQGVINAKADTGTVNQQVSNAITTAATDATNKVNAVQIGGVNLLRNSNNTLSNQGYSLGQYQYASLLTVGKTYTITVCYTLGDNNSVIGFYEDSGSYGKASFATKGTKIIESVTFVSSCPNSPSSGSFYQFPNGTYGSIIHWAVLTEGNKGLISWSPAPEDVDANITTAQTAAQTYATANCVQVGLSNAPDAIKNQVLAAAHGNFSYIDGSSIYTGTLNANQVTAGYISSDRIAANSITAGKIDTNSLTSDTAFINYVQTKIVTSTYVNTLSLSANAIVSGTISTDRLDAGTIKSNIVNAAYISSLAITTGTLTVTGGSHLGALSVATDGSLVNGSAFSLSSAGKLTCNNVDITGKITATSGTFAGTLNGVSGTFDTLTCNGSLICKDTSGNTLFQLGTSNFYIQAIDMQHQGVYNNRSLRFLTNNIRCRGAFGHKSMNFMVLYNSVVYYYVNGNDYYDNSISDFIQGTATTSSYNGHTYYNIYLYPDSSSLNNITEHGHAVTADLNGFPVDVIIIESDNAAYYRLIGSPQKEVTIINANDGNNSIYFASCENAAHQLQGGNVMDLINVSPSFMSGSRTLNSIDKSCWMIRSYYNNDFN